jgi:maltooligosyltrehalose trehalohydrolase
VVIAEGERFDASLVLTRDEGGVGLDAVWADDFHHHMRRLLAGDADGYYASYAGTTAAIADGIEQGWLYRGQCSSSHGMPRGTPSTNIPRSRFVVGLQNHGQVGNRAIGDRLHHTIDLAAWRAATALLLCLPDTPLLFMGQEWATSAPFLYFTDHAGEMGATATVGRRRELARFDAHRDRPELIPDPQHPSTYEASRLDWSEMSREPHASVRRLYRDLIAFRRTEFATASTPDVIQTQAVDADTIVVERLLADARVCLCVVRLRGAGCVEYLPTLGRDGAQEREWSVRCSTEGPAYAIDAEPIVWNNTRGHHAVEFHRPGALFLVG